jgi:hypothetical protein
VARFGTMKKHFHKFSLNHFSCSCRYVYYDFHIYNFNQNILLPSVPFICSVPNVVSHSLETISVVTKSCEVCRCDFLMRFVRAQDYPHMMREILHQRDFRNFGNPVTFFQFEPTPSNDSKFRFELLRYV